MSSANSTAATALAQASLPGTWNWNVQTDTVLGNARLAEIYDIEPSEVLSGIPVAQALRHVPPVDMVALSPKIDISIKSGCEYNTTQRIISPKGVKWVHAHGKCFLGADGRPETHVGVAVDITGFQAARGLSDSEDPLLPQLDEIARCSGEVHRIALEHRLYEIAALARSLMQAVGMRIARMR